MEAQLPKLSVLKLVLRCLALVPTCFALLVVSLIFMVHVVANPKADSPGEVIILGTSVFVCAVVVLLLAGGVARQLIGSVRWINRIYHSLFNWRMVRRGLKGLAVLVLLVAAVYGEENLRGRRAWERCKQEFAAQGESIEWSRFIPAAIPDEQNIFKAPKMTEWFVGEDVSGEFGQMRSGSLRKRFNEETQKFLVQSQSSNCVAEVVFASPKDVPPADIYLRYSGHALYLASANDSSRPKDERFPYIKFEDMTLESSVIRLAEQAQLNFIFEPRVQSWLAGESGQSHGPMVNFAWENLTARETLMALLKVYNLVWIDDPETSVARICMPAAGRKVIVQEKARDRLEELILLAGLSRQPKPAPQLSNIRDLRFVLEPLPPRTAIRVVVFSDESFGTAEVKDFLPDNIDAVFLGGKGWRVEASATNQFRIHLATPNVFAVKDYLAWSDQFAPEFQTIREALERSGAYIAGKYEDPFAPPWPDLVAVRVAAQILAERAQCYLLLGEADRARDELTLLYDLRRLLSAKPTTLVSAMMDTALTGLYTSVVGDGLRLRAWHETDLVVLQEQLARIDLLPQVRAGLHAGLAGVCQKMLTTEARDFQKNFGMKDVIAGKPDTEPDWAEQMTPAYLLVKAAPRGWLYQNLVVIARDQRCHMEIVDAKSGRVDPKKAAALENEWKQREQDGGLFTVLSRLTGVNYVRAFETAACRQTEVNEALVACGLERYHRARGEYPQSVYALVPDFVERIPDDIVGGGDLLYQRDPKDGFKLYSVGWNETDDGGVTAWTNVATRYRDLRRGDWVWVLPLN